MLSLWYIRSVIENSDSIFENLTRKLYGLVFTCNLESCKSVGLSPHL